MPAYKDEAHGTFYASFYYTDFTGTKRKKMKRGFKLKRDALEWERQFLLQKNADPDMRFGDFVSIYRSEKRERIREHTWESKDNIIDTKILPYTEHITRTGSHIKASVDACAGLHGSTIGENTLLCVQKYMRTLKPLSNDSIAII